MTLLAIYWDVDPTLFELGPLTIRWYGLLFALAFLCGYYVMAYFLKKEGQPKDWMDSIVLYMMLGTILGARLGHVFFYDWEYYRHNLIEIPQLWKGGLASHGAAIGIIIALWLYSKFVTKKSVLWALDRIVVTVALAGLFIRTGNLMNHEIVGQPTDLPWAFIFTGHPTFAAPDMLPRHPAQLYEALAYTLIFVLLFFLYDRKGAGKKEGLLFGLFLITAFTARFFIEFVKADQVAFEATMALNMGQWLSIPFVLTGVFFVWRAMGKGKE